MNPHFKYGRRGRDFLKRNLPGQPFRGFYTDPGSDVPIAGLLGTPVNTFNENTPLNFGLDYVEKQLPVRQGSNIAQLFDDLVNRYREVHTGSLAERPRNDLFYNNDPSLLFKNHLFGNYRAKLSSSTDAAPFLNYIDDLL